MNDYIPIFQSQEEYDKQVRKEEIERYTKDIRELLNKVMNDYAERITFEICGVPIAEYYQPLIITFYYKGEEVRDIIIDEDRDDAWSLVMEFMSYFSYFLLLKLEEVLK